MAVLIFALGWRAGRMEAHRQAYAALWEAMMTLPAPERCTLCEETTRRHALCLIDLSSGKMDELTVYETDPACRWEVLPMDRQPAETFRFQPCVGLTAVRDTSAQTCTVYLPETYEPINPARFCPNCRMLLAGAGLKGYVILDLYDLDHVRAYPVCKGEREVIRDYRVTVERGPIGWEMRVVGLL